MNPCMLTSTGRDYTLAGPGTLVCNEPNIREIAHHLAIINRFTGATFRPYSVAEHSLLVEAIGASRGASPALRLALLLHDAHEAYVGDVASPTKQAIGRAWREFEATHAGNVRRYFGLQSTFAAHRSEIDTCDLLALAVERRDLMPFDWMACTPWDVLDTAGREIRPPENFEIDPDFGPSWKLVRDGFLSKYLHLRELVTDKAQELAA